MKVFYDHQIFELQAYGGISRYFYEIVERNKGRFEAFVSVRNSENQYVGRMRGLDSSRVRRSGSSDDFLFRLQFRGKQRLFDLRNRMFPIFDAHRANIAWSTARMDEAEFDLFHPTYYDPYFVDHLKGRPYVVTVHDFIHEVFPEFFDPRDPTPGNKRLAIQGAKCVIAVSECTKGDIVRFCGVDPSRIHVVYHGSSLGVAPEEGGQSVAHELPKSYLLFVGRRHNYKNFQFLVEAFAETCRKHPDVHLVCAGSPFDARERRFFSNLGVTGKIVSIQTQDGGLQELYSNALGFVLPSLYEGFGIPILEAFSCNCPVAVSDASCLPEVAGDAALYFAPKDFDRLTGVLDTLISDDAVRENLRQKGCARLKMFSWEKAAEETFAVYQKALA
jgi:glycosyltransferase involved in cell wall biosynthesis